MYYSLFNIQHSVEPTSADQIKPEICSPPAPQIMPALRTQFRSLQLHQQIGKRIAHRSLRTQSRLPPTSVGSGSEHGWVTHRSLSSFWTEVWICAVRLRKQPEGCQPGASCHDTTPQVHGGWHVLSVVSSSWTGITQAGSFLPKLV